MEITQREIVIKPINRPQFSGITAHARTTYTFQGAQYGKGGYKTGLTPKEEEEFCEELGLPKGSLSKRNEKFWGSLPITLFRDKPTYFQVSSALDEIKLRTLMARDTVANSELEIKKNANALFYIEDIEAKAKIEEIAMNYLFDAMEAFSTMTGSERKGYLKLYGERGVDQLSDSVVKTMLYKKVTADPEKFTSLIKNPDVALRISIEEMLEAGTLTKKGNYYSYENETIGTTVESVIAYLKDTKHQSIKIALEAETKKVKKSK